MKLYLLSVYTFVNLLAVLLLNPNNHRANLRLELLILNSMLLQYLLTYPTAYVTLLFIIYDLSLIVTLSFLIHFIVFDVQILHQERFRAYEGCTRGDAK